MKKGVLASAVVLLGACALCCAGPLLAVLGLTGLTGIATAIHGLEMGLMVLAVAILGFCLYRYFSPKKAASCRVDCGCKTT